MYNQLSSWWYHRNQQVGLSALSGDHLNGEEVLNEHGLTGSSRVHRDLSLDSEPDQRLQTVNVESCITKHELWLTDWLWSSCPCGQHGGPGGPGADADPHLPLCISVCEFCSLQAEECETWVSPHKSNMCVYVRMCVWQAGRQVLRVQFFDDPWNPRNLLEPPQGPL